MKWYAQIAYLMRLNPTDEGGIDEEHMILNQEAQKSQSSSSSSSKVSN